MSETPKNADVICEQPLRVYYPQLLTEVMFCADHNVNKDIGTCYGDSGGPAIKKVLDEKDWSERFTLVGIVSGNPKGCRGFREYPDYFTLIGHEQVGNCLIVDSLFFHLTLVLLL